MEGPGLLAATHRGFAASDHDNRHHDEKMEQWQETMHMMVALHPERRPRFPRHAPCRGGCFRLVRSTAFERLVLLVIGVNTAAMALDGRGGAVSPWLADALATVNACCGLLFLLEMLLKLAAYTARGYFSDSWNCFDAFVVLVSVADVLVESLMAAVGLQPSLLRVLRVLRLTRLLRVIKSHKARASSGWWCDPSSGWCASSLTVVCLLLLRRRCARSSRPSSPGGYAPPPLPSGASAPSL